MHTLFSSFNIEENWSTLKNILSNLDLADKFIPKIKTTQSLTSVPWWSVGLSKAAEKKHHLYSKYLHSMSSHDFHIYA